MKCVRIGLALSLLGLPCLPLVGQAQVIPYISYPQAVQVIQSNLQCQEEKTGAHNPFDVTKSSYICSGGRWGSVSILLNRDMQNPEALSRVRLLWRNWTTPQHPAIAELPVAERFLQVVLDYFVPSSRAYSVERAFWGWPTYNVRHSGVTIGIGRQDHGQYILHRMEILGYENDAGFVRQPVELGKRPYRGPGYYSALQTFPAKDGVAQPQLPAPSHPLPHPGRGNVTVAPAQPQVKAPIPPLEIQQKTSKPKDLPKPVEFEPEEQPKPVYEGRMIKTEEGVRVEGLSAGKRANQQLGLVEEEGSVTPKADVSPLRNPYGRPEIPAKAYDPNYQKALDLTQGIAKEAETAPDPAQKLIDSYAGPKLVLPANSGTIGDDLPAPDVPASVPVQTQTAPQNNNKGSGPGL